MARTQSLYAPTGYHLYLQECFRHINPEIDEQTARRLMCDAFAIGAGAHDVLEIVLNWQSNGPHDQSWLVETWSSLRSGWEVNSGVLEKMADASGANLDVFREIAASRGNHSSPKAKPVLREIAGRPIKAGWADDRGVVAVAQRFEQALLPDAPIDMCMPTPLIEGVLDLNCLSVMYGKPGCGKTFLALDMANTIATGGAWNGVRVTQGLVVYVAAEGEGGMSLRVQSLRDGRSRHLQVISLSVNLLDVDGDVMGLLLQIKRLEGVHGPARLIVFDTLARCMQGADENSNSAMGTLTQVTDMLREATGAHVMLIHHTGKATERGMRGHSALLGACDTVLRLVPSKCSVVIKAEKQKDLEDGPVCAFRLKPVVAGGNGRSSACVEYVTLPSRSDHSPSLQGNTLIALNALQDFLAEYGEEVCMDLGSGEKLNVTVADWTAFMSWGANRFDLPDTSRKRRALKNALSQLEGLGLVATSLNYVWLIN